MPDTAPQQFLTRRAPLAPSTVNVEARTVEVIWSTGAPVQRRDFDGPYAEVLSLDRSAVDLSRLIGGPVLDTHGSFGLSNVLGVVETAVVDGREGRATVRFGDRPEADAAWRDVRSGIIRSVSVGYQVSEWLDRTDPTTGERSRIAVRWTPLEISFVPVGADAGAKVRGKEDSMADGTATTTTPADRPANAPDPAATPTATPSPAQQPAADQRATATAPQNRATVNVEIRSMARLAGLDQAWIDGQIDAGATVEQARAGAFQVMEQRGGGPIDTTSRATITHDHEAPDAVRDAMAGALAARMLGKAPEGRAVQFTGWRMVDMAADLAGRRGHRMDPHNRLAVVDVLFSRAGAHSASDFPLLLENAGNRVLLDRYMAAEPTYRRWAASRNFNDFKAHKFLRIGDFPELQEINELGETVYGSMSENREEVTPKELGTGLSIGRRAIVNDDLSAFADFTGMVAVRVAADENKRVYALIAANGPTLADGTAMFATTRGNKAAAGGAIDVANVGTAVAAIRSVTSLDGIKINIVPRFLVVGPDQEVPGRQLLTAITPAKAADVNPWAGSLELIVDANITGHRWYIFPDPASVPTVVYGYVAGQMGPQLRTETDFDTRALKVAVGLDFGYGAVDWRGAWLNEGQA